METEVVKITQERFEQLLDTETRVDVLIDTIRTEKYIAIKDIYRILGYSSDVRRIEEEEREERNNEAL